MKCVHIILFTLFNTLNHLIIEGTLPNELLGEFNAEKIVRLNIPSVLTWPTFVPLVCLLGFQYP